MKIFLILIVFIASFKSQSAIIKVFSEMGKPLSQVMVTETLLNPIVLDTSDGGYQKPNSAKEVSPEITKFTDQQGIVNFSYRKEVSYRLRKPNFKDLVVTTKPGQKSTTLTMMIDADPVSVTESRPANVWLGALDVGTAEDKIIFKMQCGFCHQQGTSFTRQERSIEDWEAVIKRMVRYGSRLPSDLQKSLPKKLNESYRQLRENPKLLAEGTPWSLELGKIMITEWPIGDAMSQTHDMLIAKNKMIYVADNIQDRLYEVDPKKNLVTVYKIPHREGEKNGGLISRRLKEFPRHDSTSNAHSLTESAKDGHLFITPSAQRRLIEFDPISKNFLLHEMGEGFYPHTIRMDQQDNVWFTLALSNQVAKFDRQNKSFTYYDLPARSLKEKIITKNIGFLYKLMGWGIPLSNWLSIDRVSSGVPLVYGIDVTPDGKVWFARLHTKEIGSIDPATGKITMIPTPFWGPRRLRTDADGNLWIGSFGESKIARYTPSTNQFKLFDLPVNPLGSETPYALNVDKKRKVVWVNGNQSDSVYALDIATEKWRMIPLPRRTTFTRDIEIDEDGTLYTSNSNFPSWHIEDSQPTLIQIKDSN